MRQVSNNSSCSPKEERSGRREKGEKENNAGGKWGKSSLSLFHLGTWPLRPWVFFAIPLNNLFLFRKDKQIEGKKKL